MIDEHRNIRTALDQEEARRVDDDYLSELQRVWQAASKGPWEWRGDADSVNEHGRVMDLMQTSEAATARDSYGQPDPQCVLGGYEGYVGIGKADAEAIAKAPEHVAALLAEVKRLREENAELRAKIGSRDEGPIRD